MPAKVDLCFSIELRSDDEDRVEECLVGLGSIWLAYVAFDGAKAIYPNRILKLRGPDLDGDLQAAVSMTRGRHQQRLVSHHAKQELLAVLGEARRALNIAQSRFPISGPEYQASSQGHGGN